MIRTRFGHTPQTHAAAAAWVAIDPVWRLVNRATPVLRILGIADGYWRGRDRKNMADQRLGPWRVPRWEILNNKIYRADGEVLYFLLDGSNRIRYIGQSCTRLRTRWRTPPLAAPADGDSNAHLFHNRAWPHVERAFSAHPDAGPFTVVALSLGELAEIVEREDRLRHLCVPTAKAGPRDCLSLRLEGWLCKQPALASDLWNRRSVASPDDPHGSAESPAFEAALRGRLQGPADRLLG